MNSADAGEVQAQLAKLYASLNSGIAAAHELKSLLLTVSWITSPSLLIDMSFKSDGELTQALNTPGVLPPIPSFFPTRLNGSPISCSATPRACPACLIS